MSWFDIFFHQGHNAKNITTSYCLTGLFRDKKSYKNATLILHKDQVLSIIQFIKTGNGPLPRSRVLLSILAGQSHWLDHCLIVYISITQPFWSDVGRSVSFHICWTRLCNQAQTHKPSQIFSWRSIFRLLEQAREAC